MKPEGILKSEAGSLNGEKWVEIQQCKMQDCVFRD